MTKNLTKEKLPTDFENLVLNGIDFLEKAISQLNHDPKHSVINFYTAVEIFLKAPLAHEYWALVVVDRDLSRQKYESGDFLSVSFEDSCTRLANTLSKPLKPSTKAAFDKVRKHRNRMVHFYHDGINGARREEIKLEQAEAWFELNRFIADTWRDKFEPFLHTFRIMEQNLITHNQYAKTKYKSLISKIEGLKRSGKTFLICPNCGTEGCQFTDEGKRITSIHCLVCFHSEKKFQIECPHCGSEEQYFIADGGFTCTSCQHKASDESEIFDLLNSDPDSDTPANCNQCQGYHTVCSHEGGYLCTSCITYFDSVGRCEWCNDPTTGDIEDSHVMGCDFCEGLAGHHADD